MKKIIKIQISIFFLFSWCLALDFLPIDGQSLNYRQIFFRWPQIVGSDTYQITIHHNMDSNTYISQNNSIILDDFSWQEEYFWEVCGLDEFNNNIECYGQHNFNINALPMNYPGDVNIITHNENLSTPGITILDYDALYFSVAMDLDGKPIWFADRTNFVNDRITVTEFSTNGNFIGYGAGGYEFTLDSEIVFQTPSEFSVHHSIVKSDYNTYFFIETELQLLDCPVECGDDITNPIDWKGDRFIEVDKNGNIIWDWNTFDYLSSNEYNPQWVSSTIGNSNSFDWTHSNSVFFDEGSNIVYVSLRNLSRITAIDYNTKEIIWNLGDPNFMDNIFFEDDFGFSHQHSAQITDEGNLLFFDNGRNNHPELSRCLEIEVNDDEPELIWEYVLPDTMLTLSRGECDRLINGNALISAGRTGNVIELDQNDEIVWHLNVKKDTGQAVSIFRSDRVPNLYPNVFSFEINDLEGNYPSFFITTGNINATIYNNGWYPQTYLYELWSDSILLGVGDLFVQNESQSEIELDLNGENGSDYILKVFTESNPDFFQEIMFTQISFSGDINNDSILNILDIVIMVNIIMGEVEEPSNADLNNDGLINILDVVLLVNMILDDSNSL